MAVDSCSTTSRTTTRIRRPTTPEEGWRYTQGDKSARRPPELLTRDHVARCINREVKAGRGSPHGGVFLDIAWIKDKLPKAAEHIKRKLPSMYHQFKQLADLDITTTPMEIGPTTHYTMGGIRVEGDTQMSTVPGLFAAGEAAAGPARREPARRQLALRSHRLRQARGRARGGVCESERPGRLDDAQVARATAKALEPFERGAQGENPYAVQHDLQAMMQDLVGIVASGERDARGARRSSTRSRRAPRTRASRGHREYNNGWHTAIDLHNLLTVSEAIARSALERKESRGAHFREDFPDKSDEFSTFNFVITKGADGAMQLERVHDPRAIRPS